ncbi:hypothetical protein Nepgr_014288 [Nepenthes gracilis]|uniref:CRC domain-containing protein n=1 Tax=Nepenthes gracilis TaxID=150966 RepID=A0AAD3XPD2_NEPGR|nr:hypothetical protein Nepgr_014288 [Nepenthes gracilis]
MVVTVPPLSSPSVLYFKYYSSSTPLLFFIVSPGTYNSVLFVDSPIYSYLSSLSPIQQAKSAAQGFPGLVSPAPVLTSPQISTQTTSLTRQQHSYASGSEFSQDNDKCLKIDRVLGDSMTLTHQSNDVLTSSDQKGGDARDLLQVKPRSPSGYIDGLLAQLVDEKYANFVRGKHFDNVPQSPQYGCMGRKDSAEDGYMNLDASASLFEQPECAQADPIINVKLVGNEPWIASSTEDIHSASSIGNKSEQAQGHHADSFSEVNHLQHGVLRHCLQYDGSQWNSAVDNSVSCNPIHSQSKFQDSLHVLSTVPKDGQLLNMEKSTSTICASGMNGNSRSSFPRPKGVGLHLNNIVSAAPITGGIESVQSPENTAKGKNSLFNLRNHFGCNANVKSSSSKIEKVPSSAKNEMLESNACIAATSGRLLSQDTMKSSAKGMLLKIAEQHAPLLDMLDKSKCKLEVLESVEEDFSLDSPGKKRKKALNSKDYDGCKRCNCKKSKCLKLYCDCFAAGFYCGESCTCQGCSNKPEYEDTVVDIRQQIESKNPLAFAPRIVESVVDSHVNIVEDGNSLPPASLRHKRGCNCKKSMCLKKYCECYQANVSCSDGCRCEGCRNVYGRKEDYGMVREIIHKRHTNEVTELASDEKLELVAARDRLMQDKVHDFNSLTPHTLSLQCSDLQKKVQKSRLTSGRYVFSPNSDLNGLSSRHSRTNYPRSLHGCSMLLEGREVSVANPFNPCENLEETCDEGHPNSCQFTPFLSHLPTTTMAASASWKRTDLRNISQSQISSGDSHPLSNSSLCWHSSPTTSTTEVDGSQILQDFGSSSKNCDISADDTPEILKDSSTTVMSVKVSSPNKKRISPPDPCTDELKSSSLGSLRSSRRFILQAVPRFPLLTPCHGSKEGTDQKSDEISKP